MFKTSGFVFKHPVDEYPVLCMSNNFIFFLESIYNFFTKLYLNLVQIFDRHVRARTTKIIQWFLARVVILKGNSKVGSNQEQGFIT